MMKDKALQLLGLNLPNNVVAAAVGVTEGQVSQWWADETFAAAVQELRVRNLSEAAERDSKYDILEAELLQKLQDLMPLFTKPMDILRGIQVLNGAKRKATPAEFGTGSQKQVIHLHMPAALAAKFIVNGMNQVIDVEGRTIATMPAKGVMKQLAERVVNPNGAGKNAALEARDRAEAAAVVSNIDSIRRLEVLPLHETL